MPNACISENESTQNLIFLKEISLKANLVKVIYFSSQYSLINTKLLVNVDPSTLQLINVSVSVLLQLSTINKFETL